MADNSERQRSQKSLAKSALRKKMKEIERAGDFLANASAQLDAYAAKLRDAWKIYNSIPGMPDLPLSDLAQLIISDSGKGAHAADSNPPAVSVTTSDSNPDASTTPDQPLESTSAENDSAYDTTSTASYQNNGSDGYTYGN